MGGRLKFAELTSAFGAFVLGVGLGAMLSPWFGPAAQTLAAVGLVMHATGMWDKHRIERHDQEQTPRWTVVAYWACWVVLGAVVVLLVLRGNAQA